MGEHSGSEISFYPSEEALLNHKDKYGTSEIGDFLSETATGLLSVIAGENLSRYYEYYNVSSVMEYFWVTHETDSFYYYLEQGYRKSWEKQF